MLYQAQFESQGDWKKIFKIQAVAVATGTFAAITLLRTLGAGAANIQTLVAEIVFLAGVSQFKRIPRSENLPKVLDAQISTPMLSSLFGWLQSQSDRLVLGLLAGVSGNLQFIPVIQSNYWRCDIKRNQ
jgi:O-antigen/teichoic acid export membrane protein